MEDIDQLTGNPVSNGSGSTAGGLQPAAPATAALAPAAAAATRTAASDGSS